jgi:hypothetical protein
MEPELNHSPQPSGAAPSALSEKTVIVLEAIAQGHSYEQILQMNPSLTYRDIFDAAGEALNVVGGFRPLTGPMAKVRERYPRAYTLWTPEEEDHLRKLIQEDYTVARIARALQRQRGAIRSRIMRLGLVDMLSVKEQDRLKRIVERQSWTPAKAVPEFRGRRTEESGYGR